MTRAILGDAVALVRGEIFLQVQFPIPYINWYLGDRFYTTDYTRKCIELPSSEDHV